MSPSITVDVTEKELSITTGMYRQDGQGNFAYWKMEGFTGIGASLLAWQGDRHDVEDWGVGAVADLACPGTVEVLWQLPYQDDYAYWKMDYSFNVSDAGWLLWQGSRHDTLGYTIGAVFDMDNSGNPEIIWQYLDSGMFAGWKMQGYNGVSTELIRYDDSPPGADWAIVGAPDWELNWFEIFAD